MDRYNLWWTIVAGALLGVLIGMVAYIVIPPDDAPLPPRTPRTVTSLLSIPNDVVPPFTVPTTVHVEKVEDDIISPLFLTAPTGTVHTVCDDLDNGLWFWNMYEERLSQLLSHDGTPASQNDADALMLSMGDEVSFFCPNHEGSLPTELLVPYPLPPGQSD